MENICANNHPTTSTKPKQPRVAFAKHNFKVRKSLESPLLADSSHCAMDELDLPPLIIPEASPEPEDPAPKKHIKKRLSLGTIATQRQELELMKESMSLDEEIEYISTTMSDMEAAFKELYAKVTYERLMAEYENEHGKKHKPVDYAKVVDVLPLNRHYFNEWAEMIEDALAREIE